MTPTILELRYLDGLPELLTYDDARSALGVKTSAPITRLVKQGLLIQSGKGVWKRITTASFREHLERIKFQPQMAAMLNLTKKEVVQIQRRAVRPLPPVNDPDLDFAKEIQAMYPDLAGVDPHVIRSLYDRGYSYIGRTYRLLEDGVTRLLDQKQPYHGWYMPTAPPKYRASLRRGI